MLIHGLCSIFFFVGRKSDACVPNSKTRSISRGKKFFSVLPSNVMLMLAVGFCSFYRLTNFPTILRVYRFTDTASDATLQINFKESLLGLHEKTDFW